MRDKNTSDLIGNPGKMLKCGTLKSVWDTKMCVNVGHWSQSRTERHRCNEN